MPLLGYQPLRLAPEVLLEELLLLVGVFELLLVVVLVEVLLLLLELLLELLILLLELLLGRLVVGLVEALLAGVLPLDVPGLTLGREVLPFVELGEALRGRLVPLVELMLLGLVFGRLVLLLELMLLVPVPGRAEAEGASLWLLPGAGGGVPPSWLCAG